MIAALGSLASWAVPKLLTFASKKLFSSPLGQQVHKAITSDRGSQIGRNIKRNFVKMMNNNYNDNKNAE